MRENKRNDLIRAGEIEVITVAGKQMARGRSVWDYIDRCDNTPSGRSLSGRKLNDQNAQGRSGMSARRELPNRRRHDVRDFTFRGLKYSIGVGYFRDGGLAELFISCSKRGSAADETARDAAIIVSIALQHGASLRTLAHSAMRDDDGNPTTAVGYALDLLLGTEPTP